jgi:hypothetical protein
MLRRVRLAIGTCAEALEGDGREKDRGQRRERHTCFAESPPNAPLALSSGRGEETVEQLGCGTPQSGLLLILRQSEEEEQTRQSKERVRAIMEEGFCAMRLTYHTPSTCTFFYARPKSYPAHLIGARNGTYLQPGRNERRPFAMYTVAH